MATFLRSFAALLCCLNPHTKGIVRSRQTGGISCGFPRRQKRRCCGVSSRRHDSTGIPRQSEIRTKKRGTAAAAAVVRHSFAETLSLGTGMSVSRARDVALRHTPDVSLHDTPSTPLRRPPLNTHLVLPSQHTPEVHNLKRRAKQPLIAAMWTQKPFSTQQQKIITSCTQENNPAYATSHVLARASEFSNFIFDIACGGAQSNSA